MIKISFSSSFKRAFRKNIQKQPALQSFSIEYDVRVIFYFVEQDKAIFIDIGSHDDAY